MSNFWQELKRRNVFKATIAYLVVAWVLFQVFQSLLPLVDAPDWILKGIALIMAIGLPVWIIVSWIYDITPQGIEKTTKDSGSELANQATNKRLNAFIIVSLSIAVIVLAIRPSIFSSSSSHYDKYAIAVLPFENLSADEDNEWFNDWVTEDIYFYLSHIKDFITTSPLSVAQYKGTDKTSAEIGKELDVSHIVSGNLRQDKNIIYVTIHLTETSSGKIRFTNKWERILDSVNPVKIQGEISKSIVQRLKNIISPEDAVVLDRIPTNNQEAYEFFKKGKALADTRSAENRVYEPSIELYKKAIALDSNYSDAYAELALMRFLWGDSDAEEIKYLNDKALEINPNTARVYSNRALMYSEKGNIKEAKENFEKALAINPNDPTTHHHFAYYYLSLPKIDSKNALIHIRKGHQLNPYQNTSNNVFLYALLDDGRVQEADELLKKIIYVYPDGALSNIAKVEFKGLIESYKKKDFTEVIGNMNNAIETDSNNPSFYSYLGDMYNYVLNDDENYLKYCKMAYELDSTNVNIYWGYYRSLLENKKFDEAYKMINNVPSAQVRYYLATDSLEKVLERIGKFVSRAAIQTKLSIYSKMGERDSIKSIFKNYEVYDADKARVYAILKERDSMYHYLNKPIPFDALHINGNNEFNPYRKEERYKAFLKKNYLPITHSNK